MLQIGIDWIFYSLLGLDRSSGVVTAVNFFIYDSIKILLILFGMIAAISFLRTFLPPQKIKLWLSARNGVSSNILASIFGAITPFCSCSSVPIFLSFLKAGVPLGVAFSFLVTSPLVNEYLVVLMLGFFGWKITTAYVLSGILLGVTVGVILGRFNLNHYLVEDFLGEAEGGNNTSGYSRFSERLAYGWSEAAAITKKIWLWVLVGVGLGAMIHNYVPQEWVGTVINRGGYWTVPLATAIGVPMYGSCAAIVPIAVVLFKKGIPLGTALAFMMATAALSLPEAIILRRAMKLQLILIFFGVVAGAIIVTGYLFNFFQSTLF